MSIIYGIMSATLFFIVGSTMYAMVDAALPVLLTSFVATIVLQLFLIALHRSRKSYVRFSIMELSIIFVLTFLVITLVQNIAIIILN